MRDPLNDPMIIELEPPGTRARARRWLKGRRLMLSAILALVEVVAFIIWRPSAVLLTVLAVVLLIACVMGATRLGPGLLRDVLWIVGIAQAIVVAIPLVVGLSFVAALVTGVVIIVALIAIAARWRV